MKTEEVVHEVLKTTKTDFYNVDPRLIKVVEGFNTRIDYGDLDELKLSIVENGVRVPLRGFKDGEFFYLNDGHRRLKAVQLAISEGHDIARVPFISEKKKSIEQRIFDILLFNDGKQLTPLELGETYHRLVACGYSFTEISVKIGKTVKHVSDMVTVADSSKDVKDMIKDGFVSASLVAEVKGKIKDTDKAEAIIKTAVNKPNGAKSKITKKDIKNELPLDKNETFTLDQVRELLKSQIEACASGLPSSFQDEVLQTPLVY